MKEQSRKQLLAELKKRDEKIAELERELGLMRQKMDLLIRRMFGKSSEKLSGDQLDLFLEESGEPELGKGCASLGEADRVKESQPKQAGRGRVNWPANLPVVEEVVDPQEVKESPEDYRQIGAEVSEQLDYEPGRFYRRRIVRRKYVEKGRGEAAPVIAPLAPTLQERGMAAPGLLAAIIVGKYVDHVPLYRQESIFAHRHGVRIPRQNMVRWMELAADWLRPIYEAIRTGVMGGGYVQVDETPVKYLSPGHGQTRQGYLWCAHVPGGDVVYHWETSRAARCLENIIPVDFTGTVQCDAYAAYASFASTRKMPLTLAGCWAHARRNFYEAREQAPLRAAWVLHQIGLLYRVERDLRQTKAGPALRAAMRASQSRPIYQRLHRALTLFRKSGRYRPSSPFAKALDYALAHWAKLGVYLHDGRLEVDNNLTENRIRPTAIGRKNYLFFGGAEAGQRSAILYTIVECCRLRGIDPMAYLRDVLTRLPSMTNWQIKDVTPAAWAASSSIFPSLRAA